MNDSARARADAIDEWAAAGSELGCDQAVMIARDNATRDALNQAARALRRELGELGPERRYGPIDLAVGDRVICRRNDGLLDVDNGTRGTVRDLGEDRVVIETDSHLVRALPAAYVAEHVEHAYALTGHGMQGATVERAIVVANARDLTAGWSYTALSRARGTTASADPRRGARPRPRRRRAARGGARRRARELLVRVQRRMTVRDDEDLAIEQLAPAGTPTTPSSPRRRGRAGPGGGGKTCRTRRRGPGTCGSHAARAHRAAPLPPRRAARRPARPGRRDRRRLLDLAERHRSCPSGRRLPSRPDRARPRNDPDLADRVRLRSILGGVDEQRERLSAERARLRARAGRPGAGPQRARRARPSARAARGGVPGAPRPARHAGARQSGALGRADVR